MKLHTYIILGLLSLSVLSCKKPEEDPAKVVGYFKAVTLNGNSDITLVQGGTNTVISTTLADEQYSVTDEVLHISGNGTITIGVSDLNSIIMTSGNLLTSGTVVLPDLYVSITNGLSNLTDFHVSGTFEGHFINNGDYKFSGSAGYSLIYTANAAKFTSPDFVSDSVTYVGSNYPSKVHATQKLRFFLGTGDLYYNGYPPIIDTSYSASGRLCHL